MGKYDKMKEQDFKNMTGYMELSKKYNCKMSEIALAWQWKKGVVAPIIGITKLPYLG